MLFRTTACATCMKLSTLRLSLRNSSRGREDQVRGFCTGLVQVQCKHLDIKTLSTLKRITLEIQKRSTEAWPAHVPALLAGRVQAGCTSTPGDLLSHLLECQITVHTLRHVDSHVFRCLPATYGCWLTVSMNRIRSKE